MSSRPGAGGLFRFNDDRFVNVSGIAADVSVELIMRASSEFSIIDEVSASGGVDLVPLDL